MTSTLSTIVGYLSVGVVTVATKYPAKKTKAFTDAEHIFYAAVFGDSPDTKKQWQCEVCSKFCEEYEYAIKSKLVGDENYYDAIMDAVDNITNTFSALTDSEKARTKMSPEHLAENPLGRGKYAWKIDRRHFVDVESSAIREEELEADEDLFYRDYVESEVKQTKNKQQNPEQEDAEKKKRKIKTMKRDILDRFHYVPRQLMNDFVHEEVYTHILTDYNVQVVLHALQAAAHMDRPTQLPLPFCRRHLCEEEHGTVSVCEDPHKDGNGGFWTPYDHLTQNYRHFLHDYGHQHHYDEYLDHTRRDQREHEDDYDDDEERLLREAREQEERFLKEEREEMIRRHNERNEL